MDPQTSNVYYTDTLTGKVAGKYLNVVPGADSYGFAGIGISLYRDRGRATDDGPIFVKNVSESSSLYGRIQRNDRLLAVNGESVDDVSVRLVYALINGKDGTVVHLRFSRDLGKGPNIFNLEAHRKNGIPLAEDMDKETDTLQKSKMGPMSQSKSMAVSTPASWIKDNMEATPGYT